MNNNAYLKIILTVIAVELLVLILKPNVPDRSLAAQAAPDLQAAHAGYTMPDALNQTPPEIVNVRIVDLAVPSTKALSVVPYNEVWNGRVKPYKVEVTNDVQLKKAEE